MPYSDTDVVLIYPPARVIQDARYDVPDFPAIGIAYLAGYAERTAGIRPVLIDARLERLNAEALLARVARLKPKVVGLSAMTHMVGDAATIAARIKERVSGVKLVLGAFHASFLPERTLQDFPIFDYVVVGEGEISFLDLLKALDAGEAQPRIPGIWYRRPDGSIHDGGRSPIGATMDEFGAPAWHLIDQEAFRKHVRVIPIMAQRGCPYSCNFCSRPYGQQVRRRAPRLIVDEIERGVKTYGIRRFKFFDETFTVNKAWTMDVCREIIARKLAISWWAHAHANTIDLELAEMLVKAGCCEVGMGVESGNEDIMATMKKGITKKRILEVARVLRRAKLPVSFNFIIGHPDETLWNMWQTVRFAAQINPIEPVIGVMVPYPGTEIWELALKGEGGYVQLSGNWNDYNKQLGNAVRLKNVSRRQMEFMQAFGYVYVHIANFRFLDLARIVYKNRILAWNILKKIARVREKFATYGAYAA